MKRKQLTEQNEAVETMAKVIETAFVKSGQSGNKILDMLEPYQMVLENIPEGVIAIKNSNVVYSNRSACEIFGYSRDELLNVNIDKLIDPEVLDHSAKKNRAVNKDILNDPQCFMIERKHKGKGFISRRYYRNTNDDAIIDGIVVFTDLTEKKLIDDDLFLKTQILNKINTAISVLDHNGNVIYFNNAAYYSRCDSNVEFINMCKYQLASPEFNNHLIHRKIKKRNSDYDAFEGVHLINNESGLPAEIHSYVIDIGDNTFFMNIARDKTELIAADTNLKQDYLALQKIVNGAIETISSILEIRDPYTAKHQRRVSMLAMSIAEKIGFSREHNMVIQTAGLLHDIGKIGIPSEILCKTDKLSSQEMSLIKLHPQIGRDILKSLELPNGICPAILQHHERIDGSGYPMGLTGESISIEAKILAVADVVEAMASHRPYRPALGIDKALSEIVEHRDILYDAEIVDACINLFEENEFHF
jgi:PAS domain S-box-containing protein/putative nucleotidyltransferase with HDIG domain